MNTWGSHRHEASEGRIAGSALLVRVDLPKLV